jgi:hypothetical protein
MNNKLAYLLLSSILVGVVLVFANAEAETSTPKAEKSEAEGTPFDKMMAVLTHKRCVNCHPSSDYPRQGEDSHLHNFGVQRGEDNHGMHALRCESCHQQENNNFSGVPGAPEWSLAPKSMAWEGLSRVEIARSMLDPEKNGGRTLEETVHHLTEHELVLWAWEPGVDASGKPREKPPVPKDEYIEAVRAWAEAGAKIPNE